jgi:hypothetical protein
MMCVVIVSTPSTIIAADFTSVKLWILCHRRMTRAQGGNGDDRHIWRVAGNMLSLGQLTRRDPLAWMLGMGLTTAHSKQLIYYM